MSRYLSMLLVLVLALVACAASFAGEVQWKVVSELDRFEPFEATVFHDGRLWVGRSRKDLAAFYRLEIFDSEGKELAVKELDHSLRFLYPYGANAVLTVGVSVKDQLTHYSIITRRGNEYQVQTKVIPLGAFADEWAGAPGALYFTDPGGLDDGSPIGQPLKTMFQMSGSSFRYLEARIRGPHSPLLVGNAIYVVQHPSMGSGGRNLMRFDLRSGKLEDLATGTDLVQILALDGGKRLAIADRGTSQVLLFDTTTKQIVKTLPVAAGAPRSIALLGNCIVVASEHEKKVSFLDLRKDTVAGVWDLTATGKKLFGLRRIAADSATGRIYVRSAYPASLVDASAQEPERNSVVLAEESDGTTARSCK